MPSPESRLVFTVKEYGVAGSNKLVLFFCPFGIRSWLLNIPGMPIWRLRKNGYAVISYSYQTAIATKSVQMTIDNIKAILADVEKRIAHVGQSVEISCFGTSMGTVMAANVAVRQQRIKKVVLNLSYADISDHIVSLPSIRTIPAKKLQEYLHSVPSEANLRVAFDPYSPLTLAREFQGKQLLVYASRTDVILKLEHTRKLHAVLHDAGIDMQLVHNARGGHYFAALYNFLKFRIWLQFLDDSTYRPIPPSV